MRNFRDLRVWQESHQVSLAVYRITKGFPRDELFGLTSQLRRAAVSIEANIGRQGDNELVRFLQIAFGSASEVECHLLLAKDLGYLSPAAHASVQEHVEDVRKMITGLMQSIAISGKRRAESGQRTERATRR